MTNLQILLEAHQRTRLLRLSFPMGDGPEARLMVNRCVGTLVSTTSSKLCPQNGHWMDSETCIAPA